jgi:DNA-binding transcriptional MerR regulator
VLSAPSDRLLSTGEVAHMLGVSTQRVRQIGDEGQLAYMVSGGGRIYRPEDVAALVEQRRLASNGDPRVTPPPTPGSPAGAS